jgi:uracil-DNA glycosylase family 4
VEGLDRNPSCARCELYKSNPDGSRCLPADGAPGDILVIGEYPTEFERKLGRPFASAAGKLTRDLIKEFAPGRNVVYANAINCKPFSKDDDLDDAAEKCLGYLAKLIEEVQPKLILLMGPLAGQGFLGRSYQPLSVRGGYAWSRMVSGPVPVFLLASPYSCGRNRLYQKAFREDLEKVLSGKIVLNTKVRAARYHVVETLADAQAAYDTLKEEPFVATDVETSGMMFEPDFRIECLAVSGRTDVYVFTRECIEDAEISGVLRSILELLDHTSWNGQYDLCAIECEPLLVPSRNLKKPLLNLVSDARLKRKLLDAEARGDLATCADLVGMGGHKDEQKGALQLVCGELRALAMATTLTPTGRARKPAKCLYVDPSQVPAKWLEWINDGFDEQKFAHRFVNKDIEHKYVALDAISTWQLEELLHAQLLDQDDLGQYTVWDEVTRPAMYAWCRARLNGFPTDKNAVQAFSDYLKQESALVLKKIHAYKPGLNPQSPKQVGEYLSSLGLKSKRKTTSGAQSWAKEVLEDMKDKHPIIPLLLRYTLLTHTDSNFAAGGLGDIRSDGRVHPSFLQDGTGTGRPSCQDPNFFNRMKGRDEASRELGNMLRACHQCPPGWTMIEADMGQIEIRVAADRSRDIAMVKMLCSGVDFHTQSSELFAKAMGMDFSKMSQEEKDIFREKSKTSNFAAIYEIPSQLGFMLSKRLKIDKEQGIQLGNSMFKIYKDLRTYMDRTYAEAWETGYARTHWKGQPARKRPLWGMGKNPPTLKELEKAINYDRGSDEETRMDLTDARATYNTDVQGSAVDIITSMLKPVVDWLDENTNGGQFLLQIYDSIMLMVRDEDLDNTLKFLLPLMRDESDVYPKQGYVDGIPLVADVKIGKSWATLKKVKV